MNDKDFQALLRAEYPSLYLEGVSHIHCEPGWRRILWDWSAKLVAFKSEHGLDVYVDFIREKYAYMNITLGGEDAKHPGPIKCSCGHELDRKDNFCSKCGSPTTYDGHYDKLTNLVYELEGISQETCQGCGEPGEVVEQSGWETVRCYGECGEPWSPSEEALTIPDSDLKIDLYRTGGVNQDASGVRILHTPTGIVVTSEATRSAHKNRADAMQKLQDKLRERAGTIEAVLPNTEECPSAPSTEESPRGQPKLGAYVDVRGRWPISGVNANGDIYAPDVLEKAFEDYSQKHQRVSMATKKPDSENMCPGCQIGERIIEVPETTPKVTPEDLQKAVAYLKEQGVSFQCSACTSEQEMKILSMPLEFPELANSYGFPVRAAQCLALICPKCAYFRLHSFGVLRSPLMAGDENAK